MKRICLCIILAFAAMASAWAQTHSWDKTVHSFGDVSTADGPLSCVFTLTNTGSEPLLIFEVVSSCGCTDVSWTRENIGPGETGTVKATYKNEDGALSFDKPLTVYLTGSKKPDILHIRGVVHEKKKTLEELYGAERIGPLGLKSRSLKAGTLKQGLSISESVTVANLGKTPLKVGFADVSPQLNLSLSANPIPAGGTAILSYTVKSSPGIYGRKIYTATPVLNGRKADNPLEITVRTQENFDTWSQQQRKNAAIPYFDQSTFIFNTVKDGNTVEAVFPCVNRGKSALRFFQADSDNPAVQVKGLPEIAPGQKAHIRFTLDTAALPKGDAVIMVSLTTNSPLRPLVNLFITGVVE